MATHPRNDTAPEATQLLDEGALLLDVRGPHEFEAGHAPMALHVALADLPDRLDELPRDRTIICICRSGGRSKVASDYLAKLDFTTANLVGGMLDWFHEGHPTVSAQGEPEIR